MSAALASHPSADDAALLAALPFVARRARRCFLYQPLWQRDESVVDAMTAAYLIFRGLREQGRTIVTNSKGLANNACRAVRNGKPMGLGSAPSDALDPTARRKGRVCVESLDVPVSGGWIDLAIETKKFGPAETAPLCLDFSDWFTRQSPRHRRMMNCLAKGDRADEVARRFKVSQGRVSQLRRRWAGNWREFQEPMPAA